MCVKQSQLKNSLSHYFVWIGKYITFGTENERISRLRIVMADIKYVDHVRNELETQGFTNRFQTSNLS